MNHFYNLTNDLAFKYVFGKELILMDFLNAYFDFLGIDFKVYKYEGIAQGSLKPKYIKGKMCYGDLIGVINDEVIIDIEMYNSFGKREFYKTKAYAEKLFTNQYEEIKDYKDVKKVLSINFITGNFSKQNEYAINRYIMKHMISNKELFDEKIVEIVLIRIDFEKTKDYNENARCFKYLKLIRSESMEEMEEIAKGDEIMSIATDNLRKFLSKPENRRNRLQESYDDGVEDGMIRGEHQGKIAGKREALEQTAKNMLKMNMPKEDISKATGLSVKKIMML